MGMITEATPVAFRDPLPERVDVVVIGGGVIGVSAALTLAEAGRSVVLCEKGRIAGEQSSRNWGWVRKIGRDAAEMPLVIEAFQHWHGMAERVGADVGFRAAGITYLAKTEVDRVALERHVAAMEQHQVPLTRLGRADIDGMIQGRTGYWTGGLHSPTDGRAEPWEAVPAMARAAQRQGAAVREDCAVRGLERTAGRVTGVITEDGVIAADAVLLAGGAWASLFLARHGVRFPQLSVLATAARSGPAPDIYAGGAADKGLAFRRREDGSYTLALTDHLDVFLGPSALRWAGIFAKGAWASRHSLALRPAAPAGYPDAWRTPRSWADDAVSPFERIRVLDPKPAPHAASRIAKRMAERLPALADVPIAQTWAGMIDAMPDVVPVMDAVPGLDGLWVAAGFSGHGFGIGPAAGRIMADLVQGRPAGHDMARFRFSRFTDGSPIRPGPGI